MNKISAIIVAAGKGIRLDKHIPKQYMVLNGKMILTRTLEVFLSCSSIDEIMLVIPPGDCDIVRTSVIQNLNNNIPIRLIEGGTTRQQSVYNALLALDSKTKLVVIHDGARPLLKLDTLQNAIASALNLGAVVVGVPVKDTIKETNDNKEIIGTPKRESLWVAQTPQIFTFDLISEAYRKALNDEYSGTDDSSLVERLGHKIYMQFGSYSNIKITTKEDLAMAEKLILSSEENE